jgi:hypothetical protein
MLTGGRGPDGIAGRRSPVILLLTLAKMKRKHRNVAQKPNSGSETKFGVRALFEGRNCKKFRVRCGHTTTTNVVSDRSSVASAHLLKKCSDPESAGKCALTPNLGNFLKLRIDCGFGK